MRLLFLLLIFFTFITSAQANPVKMQSDTIFEKHPGIDTIIINKQKITNLTLLAEVWGFLKYHHPQITKGTYNFDEELLKIMPTILKATSNFELSDALEQWVDTFGKPDLCKNCKIETGDSIVQKPNYGAIFNRQILSHSLVTKLNYILDNRSINDNFYINLEDTGNPVFTHEDKYADMIYPNISYRLLCLFRYWNIIQYFYPYKHLIGSDWNNILSEYIPRFIKAANSTDYALTTLSLVSSIHDTHANILTGVEALRVFRGPNAFPFQAKFIEDKLVVTGYYSDTLNIKKKIKIGDIILEMDGIPTTKLIAKYSPITGASNKITQLREMTLLYLVRSNKSSRILKISRNNKIEKLNISTVTRQKLRLSLDNDPNPDSPGYKIINREIGYVFAGRYKNEDLPEIKRLFVQTKGIIIDMRCYPSDFMPFTFVPYIKNRTSDFVIFTFGSISYPGSFKISKPLSINGYNEYKGKVVVIVNERTQSQAEYTTMAFQSSPNVVVIGSTTAGADGNVSHIVLPGNINTSISGIGVLYSDGTETQRRGIKIDYKISPTIRGIKAGRDELLEKAEQIIQGK